MAEFNERDGQIVLNEEDKEIFAEASHNMQGNKHPITRNIMKSILGHEWRSGKSLQADTDNARKLSEYIKQNKRA